jgi:hypothetical protein
MMGTMRITTIVCATLAFVVAMAPRSADAQGPGSSRPNIIWLVLDDASPPEELYDTSADPDEIHNLATDPKFRNVLERLRGVMDRWIKETKDLGEVPEEELLKRGILRAQSGGASSPALDSQLLQHLVRAAFPLRHKHVTRVLKIFNPHLAGPEAAGGEVAEHVEERHAV